MSVVCESVISSTCMKQKSKSQRLRSGCWTCRARGYKCDEAKPACNNCSRMQIDCEGYDIRLKWPGEKKRSATDWTLAGASDHSSPSSDAAPSHILTEVNDPEELVPDVDSGYQHVLKLTRSNDVESQYQSDFLSDSYVKSESPQYVFSHLSQNSSLTESYLVEKQESMSPGTRDPAVLLDMSALINYYYTFLADELTPPEVSSSNVYREAISPMNSDSVKLALCSITASHLASSNPAYADAAVSYKVSALQALRTELHDASLSQDVLSTCLLLATQEAREGNYHGWRSHLNGAVSCISKGVSNGQTAEMRSLGNLLEYHDALSSILSSSGPLLRNNDLLHEIDNTSFGSIVMSLLRVVESITSLANKVSSAVPSYDHGPFSVVPETTWPDDLMKQRLQILLYMDMWNILPMNLSPEAYNAAMVLKYCIVLYYYTRLDSSSFGPSSNAEMQQAVNYALYHLNQIPPSHPICSVLVWPLWQLGIVTDVVDTRRQIFARLESIRSDRSKPQVSTVLTHLNRLWALVDDPMNLLTDRRDLFNAATKMTDPIIFF